MKTIREPFIVLASLIGTAIREGHGKRRIHARLAVAEVNSIGAREYERGRDREDVLLGFIGIGVCYTTISLVASVSVGNWVAVIQSVGMFFILIPLCGLMSPLAFTDFDARFSIEVGRGSRG